MMNKNRLALLGAALAMTACSKADSSGLSTNQIQADYHFDVDTFGGKASVHAQADLYKDGDLTTHIHLDGADTVSIATDNDPPLQLSYDSSLVVYSADFDGASDRKSLSFILDRGSNGRSTTTVALPGAVALTAPLPMATVPYAGGTGTVDFTWTNAIAGATAEVTAFPSCDPNALQASTASTQDSDTGTLSVPMSTLIVGAPAAGGQCILVRITRVIHTNADAQLHSDSFVEATREDYVELTIMP